jgi:WD40 repeat protein
MLYFVSTSAAMKRILLISIFTLSLSVAFSQPSNFQQYYLQAREAYKSNDVPLFYKLIMEAHKLNPYHQGVLYYAGLASALSNEPENAVRYLSKSIHVHAGYDLSAEGLKSLEDREDFKKLKELQIALQKPVINSDTAFIIHDKTLHIESIAAGESKNIFYLGSIHKRKILKSENGKISDFTSSAQDGLTSVFGIKTDPKKNILWACASPLQEMENYDSTSSSGVFKYDLKSGKLLEKFIPKEKKEYVFGDLTLNPQGIPFISDSKNNIIFTVNESTRKLEVYFTSDQIWSLQGLAFSPDGKYLFIADYMKGIFRLDTKTKKLIELKTNFNLSVKSVDGLTFYNNTLIAIQNLVFPLRSTQYILNASQDQLTSYRIIDRGHPAFNEPTIGCVVGNMFYYVANSFWSGYTDEHQLKTEDELQEVVILKTDLTKLK